MERAWRRRLVAAVVTVTVAGCGTPGDGNLVDDWTPMADAKPKLPVVGCYDARLSYVIDADTIPSQPVSCDEAHTLETFHVGQVPDSVTRSPFDGDADYMRLFEACEGVAVEFLGGNWVDAQLGLGVTVPSGRQWEGGGRWYRCDVMETVTTTYGVSRRRGTLRGAAKPDATLARRCYRVEGLQSSGTWNELKPTDCAWSHDAEYVGAFKVPGTEMPADPKGSGLYKRCFDLVDRYVGRSNRLGYMAQMGGETAWKRGDRYVRCYAWHSDGKATGSVKRTG